MSKENTFWMQPGTAFWLGKNPKVRSGITLSRATITQVNKTQAVRCEFVEQMMWIGSSLCAIFRDPISGNFYAQPVPED